jgi:SAM-dependent methyltransferase
VRAAMSGQDERSADQNREFFSSDPHYAARVDRLATYRNIRAVIDREIAGSQRVLDIGNGGVFDYDTSLADEIVAVDLFLDDLPASTFPANVTPVRGSALDLNLGSRRFDTVVIVSVLHHLVGPRASDMKENVRTALAEARAGLDAGGKLVIMESCVPSWFARIERALFPVLRAIAGSRLLRHPPVFQLGAAEISNLIGESFDGVRCERVPVGFWILQLGYRWPSILTPARPFVFVAKVRPEGDIAG